MFGQFFLRAQKKPVPFGSFAGTPAVFHLIFINRAYIILYVLSLYNVYVQKEYRIQGPVFPVSCKLLFVKEMLRENCSHLSRRASRCAIRHSSAALKAWAWVMAFSVRFRQSRII